MARPPAARAGSARARGAGRRAQRGETEGKRAAGSARSMVLNARFAQGEWTPLMAAASGNFVRCAHELVMAGARLNAVNEDGETAMILAAFTDAAPVVALLLQCGAATHVANKVSAFVAARARRPLAAEFPPQHGQTALSVACEFNAYDSAVLLLDALPAYQSEAAQSARAMVRPRFGCLSGATRRAHRRASRRLSIGLWSQRVAQGVSAWRGCCWSAARRRPPQIRKVATSCRCAWPKALARSRSTCCTVVRVHRGFW